MIKKIIRVAKKVVIYLKNYPDARNKRLNYPKNKKETVFVTGDLGKLGLLITKRLSRRYNIVGYDLKASPLENVLNYKFLLRKMRGSDHVVHLGGIPHPGHGDIDAYFKNNVTGTLNVLRAARKNGIKRFIYLGSTAYYGCNTKGKLKPLYFPIDEAHPIASTDGISKGALDEYGQSKVIAEQLCAYFGTNKFFEVAVVRSGPVSRGDFQYSEDFDWKKDNSYRRGTFWANNDPENVPPVIYKILTSKRKFYYEAYNLLNSKTYSKIPVDEFIKKEYPKTPLKIKLSRNPSLFDISKLKKHLNFSPKN